MSEPEARHRSTYTSMLRRLLLSGLLLLVYYLLIAPIANLLRLLPWNPLRQNFDSETDSYRETSKDPSNDRLDRLY